MSRISLLWAMVLLVQLSALPSPRARAESVCADSVEWLVASSDTVVRGQIIEVIRDRGFFVDEVWDKVTIRVAETLRGEKQAKVCFVMRQAKPTSGQEPDRMKTGDTEYLFFLVRRGGRDKRGAPARFADCSLMPRRAASEINLSADQSVGLPTLDFKLLIRRGDILKAIRACPIADREEGKPRSELLWVPDDTEAFRKLWQRSGVVLVVPVDGRLEARAKQWFQSKDLGYRHLGVHALANFKTPENIRLMKSLLQSPEHGEGTTNQRRIRYYPLRAAAYRALKGWEITVKEPVTEELLDSPT